MWASKVTEVRGAVVQHGVMFEVAQDALDRIHLGCVGQNKLKDEPPVLGLDLLARKLGTMRLRAIHSHEGAIFRSWNGTCQWI